MLLTRFEPFRELGELGRGFEYLNSVVEGLEEQGYETGISSFTPTINGREANDAYWVEVDLPGVDKKDIDIKIEDNLLRVSAVRKMQKEVKENDYYMIGSYFGEISRVFCIA